MSEQTQQTSAANRNRLIAIAAHNPVLIVLLLGGLYLLGFILLWWLAKSDYTSLYTGMDASKAAMATTELQNANIAFRFDSSSGTLSVRSEQFYLAQNALARIDLLPGSNTKRRLIHDAAFPNQNLESELAKSIASIDNVQSARVHLAVTGNTGNDANNIARASVIVRLYPGRRLSETQITSITHLVAASTPNLSQDGITIIDQSGQLLRSSGKSNLDTLSSSQFNFMRSIEQSYIDRIENVLMPVLGLNAVRTQVVADVDFKSTVPQNSESSQLNTVKLEHGTLQRLTATVIVDNKMVDGEDGETRWVPRSDNEMERITELVKHAIGFNDQRGDTVAILNEPFNRVKTWQPTVPSVVWANFWRNESVWYLVIGGVGLIIFGVVIQSVRTGISASRGFALSSAKVITPGGQVIGEHQPDQAASDGAVLENKLDQQDTYDKKLLKARQLVNEDPKTVAQLVRSWIREND